MNPYSIVVAVLVTTKVMSSDVTPLGLNPRKILTITNEGKKKVTAIMNNNILRIIFFGVSKYIGSWKDFL